MNRSRLALVLSVGLLLAGCSAGTSTPEPSSSGASASAGDRVVEHARGRSTVPAAPQRVVVLEPLQLDTAVALGVTPVGAAVASNVTGVPAYLGVGDAVQAVGTVPEPDLEAIAALRPDLVLGTQTRHGQFYDALNRIAPTVFMASQSDPWQDNVRLVGRALGREDRATELLDGFQDRCEEVAAAHDLDGTTTANLLRPRDGGTFSLYGPTSFAGSALECAGLELPDRDWAGGIQVDLSAERVPEAAADHLFVPAAPSALDDPAAVPALVRGNSAAFPAVHVVDTSYWISGVGPLGGRKVLDDVDRILTTGS
ncbi:iron-siderophore ABC transporter substrate-binding protein [Kineococcus sp. NPDC059986]|uniref:iron-siderophore ABC transporter substrate-binding protein n=1 Tax=Kineococcus sp. NPDC059986 TaxID=3155538 RepID=UPI00344EA42D